MNESLWHLPGPRIFVKRAIDLMEQGCSLFIQTSQPAEPVGATLRERFAAKLRDRGFTVTAIDIDNATDPIDALKNECLIPLEDSLQDGDICARLGRQCIVVDNRYDKNCRWAAFVRRLRYTIRQQPADKQPTFIIICSPETIASDISNDVLLKTLIWDTVVTQADMLALAEALWRQPVSEHILRAVIVHVVANLAGGNISLLKVLCEEPADSLLQAPWRPLAQWAQANPAQFSYKFAMKRANEHGWVHPAHLALKGEQKSVGLVVWRAQVAVLFPWVEEQRAMLAAELSSWLPQDHEDVLARDLEIGALQYLISQCAQVPRNLRDKTYALWSIRNSLAHRESILYPDLMRLLAQVFGHRLHLGR